MSKRFTSTEKWDDPWYRKLNLEEKLFWEYICCKADNAGVWKADWELCSFQIGVKIDEKILENINFGKDRVQKIGEGLFFIKDFVAFQIGDLNSGTLTNLQKNCKMLIDRYIEKGLPVSYPYGTSCLPVDYGYKHKGKGKGKGNSFGKSENLFLKNPPSEEEVKKYLEKINKTTNIHAFLDYNATRGWDTKNWQASLRIWIAKDKYNGPELMEGF